MGCEIRRRPVVQIQCPASIPKCGSRGVVDGGGADEEWEAVVCMCVRVRTRVRTCAHTLQHLQMEEKFGVQGEITEGMSVRHFSRGCGTVLASFKAKQAKIVAEQAMDFHLFSQLFDSEEHDDAHVRYLQYQLHAQQQQVRFSTQAQHA